MAVDLYMENVMSEITWTQTVRSFNVFPNIIYSTLQPQLSGWMGVDADHQAMLIVVNPGRILSHLSTRFLSDFAWKWARNYGAAEM